MNSFSLYIIADAALAPAVTEYASGTPAYLTALPPWWGAAQPTLPANRPAGKFGFEFERFDADGALATNEAAMTELLVALKLNGKVSNVVGLPGGWSGDSSDPALPAKLTALNQEIVNLGIPDYLDYVTPMFYWGGPSWVVGPDSLFWKNCSLVLKACGLFGKPVVPYFSCDWYGSAGNILSNDRLQYQALCLANWYAQGQIAGAILNCGFNDQKGRLAYNPATEYPAHALTFATLGLPIPPQPTAPPPVTVAGSGGN